MSAESLQISSYALEGTNPPWGGEGGGTVLLFTFTDHH